ncbi:hypothetical protein [Occultella gossypii]|uniref:Uncharacterized protein n=1 Tax=Occultella gossypii TaxID=2800820 RepID=A0ABS7S7Q1_9MICO|nr:hypothetical protein [Occultella gossypii]MBZ2196382.1 hypothetical protein [Occultella gossypii]
MRRLHGERDHHSPLLEFAVLERRLHDMNGDLGAIGGAVGGMAGGGAPGAIGGASGGRVGGRLGAKLFTRTLGQTVRLDVAYSDAAFTFVGRWLGLGDHRGGTAGRTLVGVRMVGAASLLPAILQVQWYDDHLVATAHAIEGLIKQHGAVTALERLAEALGVGIRHPAGA